MVRDDDDGDPGLQPEGHPAEGDEQGALPLDGNGAPDTGSAAWIAAVQDGDGASVWWLLAERYQEDLLLFARLQIGPRLAGRVEPQDLVQEGWMRALKGLGRFRYGGPGSFRRWLKTEIARAAKDAARQGGAGRDAVATMADRGIEEPEGLRGTRSSQSPSRLADRVERSRGVWEALHDARMPPLYREVFIARVIEERPREDVAREQGVNVDTVRQQMKRARALLQGILGSEA